MFIYGFLSAEIGEPILYIISNKGAKSIEKY